MRIPKKIKVGAYTFKIVYRDDLEEVLDKQMVGMCNPNKQQIFIKHGQIKSQEISTFLHEWIEAANHIYGIGLKHIQIEALEAALYQLLTEHKL